MKKIIFISDFFLEDGITGGAEYYNNNLIEELSSNYIIEKHHSNHVDFENLEEHKNNTFIISNFMNLPAMLKDTILSHNIDYIILEHDHKYVSTNDPSKFINMLAPQKNIINRDFFHGARAVLCQSKIHAEVLQKNLLLDKVVNLSCNLWSDEQLDTLSEYINKKKTTKYSFLESDNRNKGTPAAKEYCKNNSISARSLPEMSYKDFLQALSETETLIFLPQWLESFNRLVVEAKILGCKIITNKLLGVASESWFRETKPEDLLGILRDKRKEVFKVYRDLLEKKEENIFITPIAIPKISIITSLYKGGDFIENFMKNITSQTVFDKCELLILDANSPDNEYESTIKEYEEKHPNIKYYRLDSRIGVQETMNLAIEKSTGEYLTIANVDDLRRSDHIEELSKLLTVSTDCSLIYSDCYEVDHIVEDTETFESNKIYEHSKGRFTSENMIKCLPGPMPLWRKKAHNTVGFFDSSLKYAADWDMWLRFVHSGIKFKKLERTLGLYYNNPEGLSTSITNSEERFEEERLIFNRNKDVFGEKMSNIYEGYFNGR